MCSLSVVQEREGGWNGIIPTCTVCSHQTSEARLRLRTLLGKGQEDGMLMNIHNQLLLCTTLARGSFEQLMLWGFFVNTDLTITTEKLVELFAAMDDVFVQIIDYRLDLPESKVTEIRRNYHSLSQRRDAYLDLYATGHPCPSWRQVAEALYGVGLLHQAYVVESTYVQGTIIKKYMYILISFFTGGMRSGWGRDIVCIILLCTPIFLVFSMSSMYTSIVILCIVHSGLVNKLDPTLL